jgi:hypothetical protein
LALDNRAEQDENRQRPQPCFAKHSARAIVNAFRCALVSRAQRSTSEAKWCAADTDLGFTRDRRSDARKSGKPDLRGPLQSVAVPDQRCTASLRSRCTASGTRDSVGRVGSLIHFSNSPDLLVPAARFCARGLQLCFANPNRGVGGAPRDVGVLGGTPVGHAITRHARRLRGALRPMTRDARLSALHRGGFGLPGPRFRLLRRPPSYNGGQLPCGSVQRAPRTQVVVPGGRGPCLPRRAVTSRRRRTPRLAPHSGSSLEHALNEQGWASSSIDTIRSQ